MGYTQIKGQWGENRAQEYLEAQGLTFIDRRYKSRWGEIDLIFREDDTIVFVEVKARADDSLISPLEAITPAKQRRIIATALDFVLRKQYCRENLRFDVVVLEGDAIDWIPSAFSAPSHYMR